MKNKLLHPRMTRGEKTALGEARSNHLNACRETLTRVVEHTGAFELTEEAQTALLAHVVTENFGGDYAKASQDRATLRDCLVEEIVDTWGELDEKTLGSNLDVEDAEDLDDDKAYERTINSSPVDLDSVDDTDDLADDEEYLESADLRERGVANQTGAFHDMIGELNKMIAREIDINKVSQAFEKFASWVANVKRDKGDLRGIDGETEDSVVKQAGQVAKRYYQALGAQKEELNGGESAYASTVQKLKKWMNDALGVQVK